MNAASQILRLTRAGETAWGNLPGDDWTVFQANHSTYEPLEWAHLDDAHHADGGNEYSILDIISEINVI